jgi:hypothetical protein
MVLAGSFHGLIAFGRNMLDWKDGSECLVPGTLDGVSVTFGFLAFRPAGTRFNAPTDQRMQQRRVDAVRKAADPPDAVAAGGTAVTGPVPCG